MNKETIEQYLLLEASGELSPTQKVELEKALLDPSKAQIKEEYQALMALLSSEALDVPPTNELMLERIKQEATQAKRQARSKTPWLSIAAMIMLLLIGTLIISKQSRPTATPDLAKESIEPESINEAIDFAFLNEDPLLNEIDQLDQLLASSIDEDADVYIMNENELAESLLSLEGIEI